MKYFLISLFFFLNYSYADEAEVRSSTITKNLRCLVCQGQSVYESNSNFANDIKNFVNQEIKDSKTDEEIYNFLKDKYGETILLNPTLSFKNIILWSAPALFFLIGTIVIFRRIVEKK